MYGTGAFGFLGTVNTSLTVNDLEMIYDDNSSLWGATKLSTTITNPDNMLANGITKLIISANP